MLDFQDLAIEKVVMTVDLRARAWALRHDVTAYDASYVALAEVLDVPLWARDVRLAAGGAKPGRVVVV